MKDFTGRNVAVVGMAKSGLSAVELLLKHGANVSAIDERPADKLGTTGVRLAELGVQLLPPIAAVLGLVVIGLLVTLRRNPALQQVEHLDEDVEYVIEAA